MKKGVLVIVSVLLLISGTLVISYVFASGTSSVTISSTGTIIPATIMPTSNMLSSSMSTTSNTGNYEIFKNGAYICVKNVSSGTIGYQSTNATEAFGNAFKSLAQTGGNLTVASGTYYITGSPGRDHGGIHVKNLRDVNVIFQNGAILKIPDRQNITIFTILNSSNVALINWTIDGNALNQNQSPGYGTNMFGNGISGYNCDNLQIINCTITNCRMYGVNYGSDLPNLRPASVINCTFLYNSWNGICFWAGEGGIIMGNEVAHSSDVGISVSNTNALIINNYIHDMDGMLGGGGNASWGIANECIQIGRLVGLTIINNTINNCGVGIVLDGIRNTVSGNTISNVNTGIASAEIIGFNNITQNKVSNWGIDYRGIKNFYLSSGIASYVSTNDVVAFNHLTTPSSSSSSGPAIFLYNTTDVTVCNNTIVMQKSSGVPAILLTSGSKNALVVGNTVESAIGIFINSFSGVYYNANVEQNNLVNCLRSIDDKGGVIGK